MHRQIQSLPWHLSISVSYWVTHASTMFCAQMDVSVGVDAAADVVVAAAAMPAAATRETAKKRIFSAGDLRSGAN